MIKLFQEIFTFVHGHWWVILVVLKLLVLSVVCLLACRIQPKTKKIAIFITLVLVVRVFLFENPWAWRFYNAHLNAGDIGWRQRSVIKHEASKYYIGKDDIQYLVVGSSQVGAVFQTASRKIPSLKLFTVADAGPLDFYIYREYLIKYKPDSIILYLSAFDLCKKPSILGAKLETNQGFGLVAIDNAIRLYYPEDMEIRQEMKEWAIGEILTEYKYSFIFKGLVEKAFHKKKAYPKIDVLTLTNTKRKMRWIIHLQNRLHYLMMLDPNNIDINCYFLNKFFNYLQNKNIAVYIIEGHYHPYAYANNIQKNYKAISSLKTLSEKYDFVTFVPKSRLVEFAEKDYLDAVHVNESSSERFTEHLFHDVLKTTPSFMKNTHSLDSG